MAPARRASKTDSSSSNVVSAITCGAWGSARMRRVAATPSCTGMRRSMSTTSGETPAASATASSPLERLARDLEAARGEHRAQAFPEEGLIVAMITRMGLGALMTSSC